MTSATKEDMVLCVLMGDLLQSRKDGVLPEEVKLELRWKGKEEVKEAQRGRRNIPGRGNCTCKGPVIGRSMACVEQTDDIIICV